MYLDLSEKLKFNLSKSLIDSLYRKNLITIEEKDKILHKCNLSHLFSKYSNLKEDYSNITVELYIAV